MHNYVDQFWYGYSPNQPILAFHSFSVSVENIPKYPYVIVLDKFTEPKSKVPSMQTTLTIYQTSIKKNHLI